MKARTSNDNTFEGCFAVGTTKTHAFNYKGFDLLTDWVELRFERCESNARCGLKKLLRQLHFTHGGDGKTLDDIFGLPYTSSGCFAAIWVTNCEAYKMRNGKRHFLDGIALDRSLRPIALYTVRDENGNEVEEVAEIIE